MRFGDLGSGSGYGELLGSVLQLCRWLWLQMIPRTGIQMVWQEVQAEDAT